MRVRTRSRSFALLPSHADGATTASFGSAFDTMGQAGKKKRKSIGDDDDGPRRDDGAGATDVKRTTVKKAKRPKKRATTTTAGATTTTQATEDMSPTLEKPRASETAKKMKKTKKANDDVTEDGEIARGSDGEAKDAKPQSDYGEAATTADDQENEEVRNILRQPRYFDDDYEAAALRCFRCGQGGHREAECELPAKKKACHLCGYKSHIARDCPHGLCFNCLTPGHQSRDCPYARGSGRDAQERCCLRCGKSGHVVADCVYRFDASDLAQIHCYVCGSKGHLCCAPQDSLPPGLPSCCRCGGDGHLDTACAHSRRGFGGGAAPDFACFHCGQRGHIARECPSKNNTRDGPGTSLDFSRAPQTFSIGSGDSWRGGGGRTSKYAKYSGGGGRGRGGWSGGGSGTQRRW